MVFVLCVDSLNMLTNLFSCTQTTVQRNNLNTKGFSYTKK